MLWAGPGGTEGTSFGGRSAGKRSKNCAPACKGTSIKTQASHAVRAFAQAAIDRFNVKAAGPDAAARSLSGGNLQKFIVGREILQGPRVMIAAQPTRGVDIGASAQIRQALIDLRDAGVAVLLVSEELDELFDLCDKIAVMARGRLSPLIPVRQTSAQELGLLMGGAFPPAGPPAIDPQTPRC
jgi:simple sugar transport system ATP-binding protein